MVYALWQTISPHFSSFPTRWWILKKKKTNKSKTGSWTFLVMCWIFVIKPKSRRERFGVREGRQWINRTHTKITIRKKVANNNNNNKNTGNKVELRKMWSFFTLTNAIYTLKWNVKWCLIFYFLYFFVGCFYWWCYGIGTCWNSILIRTVFSVPLLFHSFAVYEMVKNILLLGRAFSWCRFFQLVRCCSHLKKFSRLFYLFLLDLFFRSSFSFICIRFVFLSYYFSYFCVTCQPETAAKKIYICL